MCQLFEAASLIDLRFKQWIFSHGSPLAIAAGFFLDGGAMQEAVESRTGHDRVTGEDVGPFGKGLIWKW